MGTAHRRTTKPQRPTAKADAKREIRKAWVKETAAGFVRLSVDRVPAVETERRDVAYRAVDLACHIWDQVEGRFLVPEGKDATP